MVTKKNNEKWKQYKQKNRKILSKIKEIKDHFK